MKETFTSILRATKAICAMSFSLLDMDSKQLTKDKNKINILKNLLKGVVLLKPGKGNGIVLVSCLDYKNSVKQMFSGRTKFRKINEDPTFRRLSSIQQFLRQLKECKELSGDRYQRIRLQNGWLARAYGLPKIHKEFVNLPKFRPITDTTGNVHYHVVKYLSELLNPLTNNEHTIKNSFDTVTRIKNIPQELLDQGYRSVLFDVVSLFTNLPLQKTINIILKKVYVEKVINTTIKKNSMRKRIKDICKQTAFLFDSEIYKQIAWENV